MASALTGCNDSDSEPARFDYQAPPQALTELAQAASEANADRAVLLQISLSDGTAWRVASGQADAQSETLANGDEQVEIGSISKVFLAATVLRLAERGELDLEAPVTNWIAEEDLNALTDGNGALLKVRHLLNHSTGMGDYLNFADDNTALEYYGTTAAMEYAPEDLIATTIEFTLNPQPGYHPFPQFTLSNPFGDDYTDYDEVPRSEYSNTGYVMLGMILEAVTARPYEDVISQEILEPLELDNTTFGTYGGRADLTGYAIGLEESGENPVSMSPTLSWAAGQTISTLEDMARFIRALYQGEVFEQPQTLAMWKEEYFKLLGGEVPYGLGIFHYEFEGSSDFYWHSGQTFGAEAVMAFDVTQDAVYTAAVNNSQYLSHQSGQRGSVEELMLAMAEILTSAAAP